MCPFSVDDSFSVSRLQIFSVVSADAETRNLPSRDVWTAFTSAAWALAMGGQPSIYFPIGDHVNVSWCCSHTNASGVISTSHIVASHITKLLLSFRQILQFRFWDNRQGRIPPWKVTKTRPFLSMCYGDPSATEVPPCCETATKKLTFSTTSVLLLLNMPLSLSRATIFRRQKNPRRVYRPKIAGILFVCNEPEGKYYTVPTCCWLPKQNRQKHPAIVVTPGGHITTKCVQ